MYYKATTTVTYTYPPQTIIGSDGLISLVSNDQYFMIDNTGSTQKIYAKGLSANKPSTSGTGELYISNKNNNGLVKTLVTAMTKIKECLATAKYDGSNAVAQDHATNALNAVISELNNISIIANS